jgi:peptidoglycan/xylan/chitin deacetylase (PgdA/CDA1 family)
VAATRTPPEGPPSERSRSRADLERRRELQRVHRRRRRIGVAAGLGLLAILVAVLALAGGGGSSRDKGKPASPGNTPDTKPAAAKPGRKPAKSAAYRRESRAITRVLSYAPFVSRGSPSKREVALTIDDGPGPLTPRFVSTLRRLHAPATFFIVGQQLNSFEQGLRDEIRGGFPIGDHTEQHPNLASLPRRIQNKQIQDVALRIRSYGVPYPRLFRPPYGAFNRQTLTTLHGHRMLAVLWTVDTGDFALPGAGVIAERAVQGAKPGAIILMHDGGGDRSQTLAALPAIVHRIRARGFKLVTVPQMLLHDPPSRRQVRPPGTRA